MEQCPGASGTGTRNTANTSGSRPRSPVLPPAPSGDDAVIDIESSPVDEEVDVGGSYPPRRTTGGVTAGRHGEDVHDSPCDEQDDYPFEEDEEALQALQYREERRAERRKRSERLRREAQEALDAVDAEVGTIW